MKGGEEKKGRKKLEMKAIERKGGICRIKGIRGGRKGIVAIWTSMGAIRGSAFAIRKSSLCKILRARLGRKPEGATFKTKGALV